LQNTAEHLPVSIREVKRCGTWQSKDQQGYYRILVGDVYDGAGSELYIQLVTDPGQNEPSKIIKTIPISELNNDHAQYYFQSVECVSSRKATNIIVNTLFEHDEKEKNHQFSITMIDVDRYQLIEKFNIRKR
jgi:hypothetical protein